MADKIEKAPRKSPAKKTSKTNAKKPVTKKTASPSSAAKKPASRKGATKKPSSRKSSKSSSEGRFRNIRIRVSVLRKDEEIYSGSFTWADLARIAPTIVRVVRKRYGG